MKIIIIGGVAGGATAAARLRRLSEESEIILFERGEYISYANCGLPYYIGGSIREREKLFVQTLPGFIERYNIDVRPLSEVIAIFPEKNTVEVCRVSSKETYIETFDKLIIATGAEPIIPPIPGIDSSKLFTLRNVSDTDKIKSFIHANNPRKAVVVGGGFIGLEMAENLHSLGLNVQLVEMADQVMAPLDFSMAALVHQHLESKKIGLLLNEKVNRFSETNDQLILHLGSGNSIETDLVIWSAGVRPEINLAKNAGLHIGSTGGITVNEYLQTSDANIYAVGDAVEVLNPITGKPALIPLAGPANKQARIAANNIIEGNTGVYTGTIGTSIAKVFDLSVATAGVSSKILKKDNIQYLSSITHGTSHAGYYPGAMPLSIKIIFSPVDGQLFGAQVVGFSGVDKRIEMLSQVIQNKGYIHDLAKLEQAYAPPYSSAKDPVNIAGLVAENILKKRMKIVHWHEISRLNTESFLLVDVRTATEYALNRIENAINIPLDELRQRLHELPENKQIIVYCAVGFRGYLAYRILVQNGFSDVYNLSGGYKTYAAASREQSCMIENPKISETMNLLSSTKKITVNACGLACPGPVMQLKKQYDSLQLGEQLEITATDPAFEKDAESWCKITGAKLLEMKNQAGVITATIEKTNPEDSKNRTAFSDGKTLIVFSDDLDKAIAAFVLANGMAATGKKVSMFFTFWGLSVIKKQQKPEVKKDLFGKMFGMMLPASSQKLSLSKMNMGGIGAKMMRLIMRRKNIESLESLIYQAREAGVEMIGCTMSMDVMGVRKEELIDGIQLGGVAAYLERAENSNVNLFV